MKNASIIQFQNVTKTFDDQTLVLDHVSFSIKRGKFYTLLGPSGCGKTTILRLIAGFTEPTSGDIYFNGEKINHLPPNKRQVNTVFQDYALFPHLNVFENVAFGLRIKKLPKSIIEEKVKEALHFVNLDGYEHRDIVEMSGGQKQRVAIARAIVNKPAIILADEPTGALDTKTGVSIMEQFRELNEEGTTLVIVTHEPEIAKYAQRTIFVRDGVIVREEDAVTGEEADVE